MLEWAQIVPVCGLDIYLVMCMSGARELHQFYI